MLGFSKQAKAELAQLQGQDLALAEAMTRLAHEKPELRAHLVPVLREASENWAEELDAFRALQASDQSVTHTAWVGMTVPEKYAAARKVAHQALLKSRGLTKETVRNGMGFMVYNIDGGANKSKFYEGLIVEEGGGFRVIRRWGALTDSGETGRVDGAKFDFDDRYVFPTLSGAQRELRTHYAKRMQNGYKDAFGPEHQTPDGKKLPMGEYPVGLSRAVGFGWGTQSVTFCIPALRHLHDQLDIAINAVEKKDRADYIKDSLVKSRAHIQTLAKQDSTMAAKMLDLIDKALKRIQGSSRMLPDPDNAVLGDILFTLKRYVGKQLSLCNG